MTTPNEKKAVSDHRADAPPSARESLPVRQLLFRPSDTIELPVPGRHGGRTHAVGAITAGTNTDGTSWTIAYQPAARLHRVTFKADVNSKDPPRVFYIPESWAIFELE